MLKLVWKDVVAAGWILLVAYPLYVVQLAGIGSNVFAALFVTFLFTSAFAFGSVIIEEVQSTEPLWCSLPVSRAEIVLGRYATTAIGVALGLGTSWIVGTAVGAAGSLGTGACAGLLAAYLLAAALYFPCHFRLGVGRGVTLFGVLLLAALVVLSLSGSLIVHLTGTMDVAAAIREGDARALAAAGEWMDRWGLTLAAGLVALAAIAFAASAALSTRLYAARDC